MSEKGLVAAMFQTCIPKEAGSNPVISSVTSVSGGLSQSAQANTGIIPSNKL